MALLSGPHVLAIHFVVPPGIAEVSGDHVRSRMNMADHALARRNGTRELMPNGMAGFVAWNGGIGGVGLAPTGVHCRSGGMLLGTALGIDNMARPSFPWPPIARVTRGGRKLDPTDRQLRRL